MADEQDLGRRLDMIAGILRIAHEDAIETARDEIRKDKTYKAILDLASDWTPAGKLQAAVVKKSGQSERTFRTKASELVDRNMLERRGTPPNVDYRATGLI